MGRFTKKWSFLIVAALILEMANASNLKWVAASDGKVPPYSVVGGENFSGEVLYVARVRLNSGLTPGKMVPSFRVAHTSYGGKEIYNTNYEILTNPGWKSHLEWQSINTSNQLKIVPKNAVVGGDDAGKASLKWILE